MSETRLQSNLTPSLVLPQSPPGAPTLRGASWVARLLLPLLAVVLLGSSPVAARQNHETQTDCTPSEAPESKTVKVKTERKGEATRFYVQNRELGEVTMTFELTSENLKGDVTFPYTATFPPGKVTEAFTLTPINPNARWEYSYTNYFKLGSNRARHDDNYIYELPYVPGEKFKVTQGYDGKFSHTGPNEYATDFKMPEGTLVLAARGGLVIRVKDDSDQGGPSMDYDRYNNYVLIRHADGTLAHYCHLQQGGCLVRPGQRVRAGDAIAHSGNTGFSTGAHLHFCVFKTRDGRHRISIPVKFRTSSDPAATLLAGHSYRAPEGGAVAAKVMPAGTQAVGGTLQ